MKQEKCIRKSVEIFMQQCKTAGIKVTTQRVAVFRELSMADDHPDAESLHGRLKEKVPGISLDTVYRTLWLLNEMELINTLGISRERTRFDANLAQHHHFVCNECGLTLDFYSPDLNDIHLPSTVNGIGKVNSTHVEARGVCIDCIKKSKKNQKN